MGPHAKEKTWTGGYFASFTGNRIKTVQLLAKFFVVYLTMLVTWNALRLVAGWVENNELERMSKEAVVAYLIWVRFLSLPAGTKDSHEQLPSGYSVSRSRFELDIFTFRAQVRLVTDWVNLLKGGQIPWESKIIILKKLCKHQRISFPLYLHTNSRSKLRTANSCLWIRTCKSKAIPPTGRGGL
jgi:hypothetical protein